MTPEALPEAKRPAQAAALAVAVCGVATRPVIECEKRPFKLSVEHPVSAYSAASVLLDDDHVRVGVLDHGRRRLAEAAVAVRFADPRHAYLRFAVRSFLDDEDPLQSERAAAAADECAVFCCWLLHFSA